MKKRCLLVCLAILVLVMSSCVLACVSYPVIEKKAGCKIIFEFNYNNDSAVENILLSSQNCQVNPDDINILKEFILNGYSVKEQTNEDYANFLNEVNIQNNKTGCDEYYIAVHRVSKWTGYIKNLRLKNQSGADCPMPNCIGASYTLIWNDLVVNKTNISTVKKIENIEDYRASVNFSCNWDSDCGIKDVHSCCGDSYECVNKNSVVNSTLVEELCKKEKGTTLCGSLTVNYCKCVNKFCRGFLSSVECPNVKAPSCIAQLIDQGVDDKGCQKTPKCIMSLSNGKNAEIKVLPETASQNAANSLGNLGFNVTLKEVGNGDNIKPVYDVFALKDVKVLGFIKAKAKVGIEVDTANGGVLKTYKPWWGFLAGI